MTATKARRIPPTKRELAVARELGVTIEVSVLHIKPFRSRSPKAKS
jgi:hypothetical protein